jgi:hypothetical protein
MKFHNWLKKQGTYADSRDVLRYLKNRKEEKAREIEDEVKGALSFQNHNWMFISVKVWEDEYYNF